MGWNDRNWNEWSDEEEEAVPLIESTFTTSWWLSNGHVQTILPALWPVRRDSDAAIRERLILRDGDFVDLDWRRCGSRRLVVLSHGLEGSSRAVYIERMAGVLRSVGWDVMAWSYRGCSGEMNRALRWYHSGESGDLSEVVAHAAKGYDEVILIGFSLGGNLSLKYLGEAKPHEKVRAAVAISTPVDLAASARVLDGKRRNRIYLRRFLRTLIRKVKEKAVKLPDKLDVAGLEQITTFREFDRRYTAPLNGFVDEEDYWAKASSLQFLSKIAVPSLLLNARNDPFLSEESYPVKIAEESKCLYLEMPESGGHVGFVGTGMELDWMGRRAVEFVQEMTVT